MENEELEQDVEFDNFDLEEFDEGDYEEKVKEIRKQNDLYLDKFVEWLENKGLVSKTIKKHVSNVEFYINDYLNYYDPTEMSNGCYELDGYLGDWFIRKCMWSTASSVKSTAASIKKFYLCMSELGYIEKDDYIYLCDEIKESLDEWVDRVESYNSGDFSFYDIF